MDDAPCTEKRIVCYPEEEEDVEDEDERFF
jgi:hypothetical protein